MSQSRARIDRLPMVRVDSQGPYDGSSYEVREVDPAVHDEYHRRAGSVRQAQYGRAPGFAAPGASFWAINRQGLDLTSSAITIGLQVRVGSIQESSGTTPLLVLQRQNDRLATNNNNRVLIYLSKSAGSYSINAEIFDDAGSGGLSVLTVGSLSANTDYEVMLYSDGGLAAGASVTLDVGGTTDNATLGAGTYTLSDCVAHILPGTAAEGDLTVVDPVNLFAADVSSDGLSDVVSRTPTTTPTLQLNCDAAAPISPGTGTGDAYPFPSAPLISSGDLAFSGLSGCLRLPYRDVFDQFATTNISSTGSTVFAFKLVFTPQFFCSNQATTLIDFPGLFTVGLDTSLNPTLTYSDQSEWVTTGISASIGSEYTLYIGCDGTNLYAYNAAGTSDTEPLTGNLPDIDLNRVPDMFIGAPEDPATAGNFHGLLSELKLFNYAATSDDGEPLIDLDFTGTEPRDRSKYRIPVASEPHTTVSDALPMIAPGPVQDQAHAAILAGEVFVGTGTTNTQGDAYLRAEDGGFSNAATAVRFGDRIVAAEPDGALTVTNTESKVTRPLGVPEVQASVSVRTLGTGVLDGAYGYGCRYVTGDGTYGPVRRLKSVAATGETSVLLGGSGSSTGEENTTELGESYGLTNDGYENYFEWDDGALTSDSDEKGYSVESYLRFPEFASLEESIFDRGSQRRASGSNKTAWASFAPGVTLNFTQDFTMQYAFRFDDTLSDAETETQCIFAIGHNDPDPWTRPFMLMLYKDPTGSLWGGGDYRLVAARCYGRKNFAYTPTVVDDSGIWENGHDYNVVAVRRGNALEIHVHDYTDDEWYHFTSKAAAASSARSMSDFFGGRNNFGHTNKATHVHFGAAAFREEGGSSGNHCEEYFNTITTTGGLSGAQHTVGAMSAASIRYHHRAWSTALNKAEIIYESEKRRAATQRPSGTLGPLTPSIRTDVAYISDHPTDLVDKFYDRVKDVYWLPYAENSTTSRISSPSRSRFEQSASSSATVMHGVYMTDDSETDPAAAEYQLYASSVGEGSIILSTPEESTVLATALWDDNTPRANLLTGFDPANFNWYTTTVVFETDSTEYDLTILDLAVNGTEYYSRPLTGPTTKTLTKADFRVYLGGFDGETNDEEVHIGEFRLWSKNRYDDSSETYDYLNVRVPADERSEMYLYATFQPADEADPVDGEFTNRGSLQQEFKKSPSFGSWDGTNDAEIVDGRDLGGEVENPPPAIAFPSAPYPHITAIEVFRTATQPISDPQDDTEVSRALLAADGAPLRFLTRLPIGTPSYIDSSLDITLGAEVDEGSGFAPGRVSGVFTWENRIGVFREGTLQLSESGPFGWESFLAANQVVVPNTGTSDITAAAFFAGSLAVFGSDWCSVLNGSPTNYRTYYIGGAGAQSARSVAAWGGDLYALDDSTLWRITAPSGLSAPQAENFGLPIQDLLPSNGRLAVSARKSSLYVVNESTGETLRFHFPTQRWVVEDRDALSVGDTGSAFSVVHSGSGGYSNESNAVAGDDVNAGTTGHSSGTINGSSTITMSDPDVPAGTRVLVIDADGDEVLTRVVSYAGGDLTVTTGALSSLSGACTVDFGVGQEGMVTDTGWYPNPAGSRDHSGLYLSAGVIAGSGFEVTEDDNSSPGDRSAAVAQDYVGFTSAHNTILLSNRGEWVRTRVRNRHSELGKLDHILLVEDMENAS